VHLLKEDGLIKLQVEDNGVGFEFDPQVNPGHRGLANILSRAAQLNANLEIISAPHQGTRLILTLQDNRH
jgi:NarL family two-component system sensor histidine kinase LiaS